MIADLSQTEFSRCAELQDLIVPTSAANAPSRVTHYISM